MKLWHSIASFSAAKENNSSGLADRWRQRWLRWLERRSPASPTRVLDHSSLLILPTGAGMAFLLVIFLLWLLSTNYMNNLIYGLTFLLLSVFIFLPLHTFANLSGLQVQFIAAAPAFAGSFAEAQLSLTGAKGRAHGAIQLYWTKEKSVPVDLLNNESSLIRAAIFVSRRGRLRAPRIKVESSFPLGFFCCWSWIDLNIEFLVYPQPKSAGPLPIAAGSNSTLQSLPQAGDEDFIGLKPYRLGDALHHLAWKQYARGRDLHCKEYARGADRQLWLDWELLAGRDVETRLSNLCCWALEAESVQLAYGLRLPGQCIDPAVGSRHLHRVLSTLALFQIQEDGAC